MGVGGRDCLPCSLQNPGKGFCWSSRGHLPCAGPACSVWAAELGSLCLDHTRSAFQDAAVFCPTLTSCDRSSWVGVGTNAGLGPPAPLWLTSAWGIWESWNLEIHPPRPAQWYHLPGGERGSSFPGGPWGGAWKGPRPTPMTVSKAEWPQWPF